MKAIDKKLHCKVLRFLTTESRETHVEIRRVTRSSNFLKDVEKNIFSLVVQYWGSNYSLIFQKKRFRSIVVP